MSKSGFVPQYQKIYEKLKDDILGGNYAPESQIPCERELCETYSVQRITVRRALDMLVRENLIYKRPGLGTFVRREFPPESMTVTMRFEIEVFNAVAERFGRNSVIVRDDDGHFCITGLVTPDDAFFGWVFGMGRSVAILAPESAKRRMCALIEGVQARYLEA